MTQFLLPALIGGGLFWNLFHTVSEKKSRRVGCVVTVLSLVCFILYFYGVTGVGLSELILFLLGKAGIAL